MLFGIGTDIVRIPRMADNLDRYFTNIDIFNITTAFTGDISGNGNNDIFTLEANVSGMVNGNAGNDTLPCEGNVFNQTTTTTFRNIDNITGKAQTDNIDLTSNGFAGLINGAGGIDSVLISATGNQLVEIGNRINTNLNIDQIENITANENATRNELIGDIAQATANWNIDGTNTGQLTDGVNTVNFTHFTDISGANGNVNDIFTVSGNTASGLSGLINGMAGDDRLTIIADGNRVIELGNRSNDNLNVFQVESITANSSTVNELISDSNAPKNNWIVNTNTGGTLSDNGGNNTTFNNFSTLSGGITVDDFVINSGMTISTLNGGGGNDIFTIAGNVTDSVNGGTGADSVTLNSGSDVNRVNLGAGNDRFTINGGIVRNGVYGDDDDDTFVSGEGSVNLFDGGNGGNDRVSYTTAVTITLGDTVGLEGVRVNNIEGVEALNGNGTINAREDAITTTWAINGNNAGQVYDDQTDPNQALSFNGFSTINGGDGVDIFTVSDNGSVSGSINGNGGDDRLNIRLAASRPALGQINFTGGANSNTGGDVITITGEGEPGDYTETWNPASTIGMNIYDQLIYDNGSGVTFAVNYRETETVNNNIQTTSLTINSVANNDVIELGNNAFGSANSANEGVMVNYQPGSKPDITVLAQDNEVNIVSNVSIANNLTITASTITQDTASSILIADRLTLDNINQTEAAENRLRTNVDELTVINNNGSVFIDEQNDIVLAGISDTSGNINIRTAEGSITSTADLATSGTLNLDAADNVIDLSGGNQLTGELTLSGSAVTINNTVATTLTNVTAQNLTINSAGDITGVGPVVLRDNTLPGLAQFTSTTGNITLNNEDNNFDIVELNTDNGIASLNESSSITVTNTQINGALTVTASTGNIALGDIKAESIQLDASAGAIVNQSSQLDADSITLTATSGIGSNDSAINTATSQLSVINFSPETTTSGTVNINNNGNVTITDLRNYGDIRLTNTGNITLGVTDSSGAIDANYGGDIGAESYAGEVIITSQNRNSFSTLGEGTNSGNADIIAESLIVNNVTVFGTQASPIGLRVNDEFILPGSRGAVYYLGNPPRNITTSAELLQLAIRGFIGLSSQQLIDVETLGGIDQAIFTEVRNYNYDDVAILLPVDQRYDNRDDERDDEKNEEEGEDNTE